MELAIDILQYVNAGAALALAIFAIPQSRKTGRPGRWGAGAFAAFAAVLLVGTFDEDLGDWATKALVCVLLAFPYPLLRFSASFGAVPASWVRVATAWTGATLAA